MNETSGNTQGFPITQTECIQSPCQQVGNKIQVDGKISRFGFGAQNFPITYSNGTQLLLSNIQQHHLK